MTTRIINGIKFEYEVTERTEKELLEIAAQDESFDMGDFETPDVKIAVGDVFDEFLNHEVFELDEIHEAVEKYFEEVADTLDEDATSVMYVIGDATDKIYTSFEAPDVIKSLEVDDSIMDYRENELKKLIGLSWTDKSELENDLICAIGQTDYLNFEAYAKITPEVGVELYVEDEPRHSYYDIDLDYEDNEMTITDVKHYIMF